MTTLRKSIQDWLAEYEAETNLPLEELGPMFATLTNDLSGTYDLNGVKTQVTVDSFRPCFAIDRPDEYVWDLFLPAGPWTSGGIRFEGLVLHVPADGEPMLTDWATIRSRTEFRVRPQTCMAWLDLGHPEHYNAPVRLHGPAWDGTVDGYDDADSIWTSLINDEGDIIHPATAMFAYDDDFTGGFAEGVLLEIATSQTFADDELRNVMIEVNDQGGVTVSDYMVVNTYFGRVHASTPLGELVERGAPSFLPEKVDFIESKLLDSDGMRPVLQWLQRRDPMFDPDDCLVRCVGFEGSVSALLLSPSTHSEG